jgi:hypothetical protein
MADPGGSASLGANCRIEPFWLLPHSKENGQTSPAGPREALWPDEKGIVMRLSFRAAEIAVVLGALTAALTGAAQSAGAAADWAGHGINGSPASPASPWSQTNYNAAASRANLTEKTLTRTTVSKVRFLRSMTAPLNPPNGGCAQFTPAATPALTGGDLYAITNGKLSKYNAATGRLIWRVTPDPTFGVDFESSTSRTRRATSSASTRSPENPSTR